MKMATERKMKMIRNRTGISGYGHTFDAIVNDLPEELLSECTARQAALIIDTCNRFFQNGRASMGAEIIDSGRTNGMVYVDCLENAIEWKTDSEGKLVFSMPYANRKPEK